MYDILSYVKYCIVLFDECTINGLGKFRFTEAPPQKDNNNNLVKKGYFLMSFEEVTGQHPRLAYLISSKQNCTTEEASQHITHFVRKVLYEINRTGELWMQNMGLLKKNGEGHLVFISHKFKAEELKTFTDIEKGEAGLVNSSVPLFAENISEQHEPLTASFVQEAKPVTASVLPAPVQQPSQPKSYFIPVSIVKPEEKTFPAPILKKQPEKQRRIIPYAIGANNIILIRNTVTGLCILSLAFIITASFWNKTKTEDFSTSLNEIQKPFRSSAAVNTNNEATANDTSAKLTVITVPVPVKEKEKAKQQNPLTGKSLSPQTSSYTTSPQEVQNETPAADDDDNPAKSSLASAQVETYKPDAGTIQKGAEINPVPKTILTETGNESKKTGRSAAAAFPGGNEKLAQYIQRNIIYPIDAIDNQTTGTVLVSFTIDKKGKVINPVIENSLGSPFDKEIYKLLRKMPAWTPAIANGDSIESKQKIKIRFDIQNQ